MRGGCAFASSLVVGVCVIVMVSRGHDDWLYWMRQIIPSIPYNPVQTDLTSSHLIPPHPIAPHRTAYHFTAQHTNAQHYAAQHLTAQHYTVLYHNVLYSTLLSFTILDYPQQSHPYPPHPHPHHPHTCTSLHCSVILLRCWIVWSFLCCFVAELGGVWAV